MRHAFRALALLLFAAAAGCLSGVKQSESPGIALRTEPVSEAKVNLRQVSDEEEYRLGQFVEGVEWRERFAILLPDHPLVMRVDRIGQRVVAVSDRPGIRYTFRVLNEPQHALAFATYGGFIYISTGMLNLLGSEDELAAVLAHESAHITHRHNLQKMIAKHQWSRVNLALSTAGALAGMLAVDHGIRAAGWSASLGQSKEMLYRAGLNAGSGLTTEAVQALATVALSAYSRTQEQEADEIGFRYLSAAGFSPTGSLAFYAKIQQLQDQEAPRMPGFLSTHPSPAKRQEAVERYVRERGAAR